MHRLFCDLYGDHCGVVQLLSHVRLCDPMDCPHQLSLSSTISWSLLKFMSVKLVMLSNHLILCHPLFILPSILPSIRVFSNESPLHITVRRRKWNSGQERTALTHPHT